jgi:Holliday junction resolvase
MPTRRKLRGINFFKTYKNKAEQAFAVAAMENGWMVTKSGYPDFICYKGNDIILVEVKPSQRARLKISQQKFMNSMSKFGVKCYKWYPERNWLRIK